MNQAAVRLPATIVLDAYETGRATQLVTGRSLRDLVAADKVLVTILEHLRRAAKARYGMATLTYSIAAGLEWDQGRIEDARDRRTIETALRSHGLGSGMPGASEVTRTLRGLDTLLRTPTTGLAWADGRPMRFLTLLEFTEHLAPGDEQGRTEHEITSIELAHLLCQSLALRNAGNLLLFHGREGRIDRLVSDTVHHTRLQQPDELEKIEFISGALRIHAGATFEPGVTADDLARLTASTPNAGIELELRASSRSGAPVTSASVLARKSQDVAALSEGTLTVLDTGRVNGVELAGLNVRVPLAFLERCAKGLLAGDPRIPSNIILAGPPASGKTDLALIAALRARASAYLVTSPKAGIVGETERRASLLGNALVEWTPNVAFIDEITEAMPLERSDFDGDSGATRAVSAVLLTTLSDERRRGRSLLLATTNCPWRMGKGMETRFTIVPVLGPLRSDYPAIIRAIASRLVPDQPLDERSLGDAADSFYTKGATPREIRAALGLALLDSPKLTPQLIERAARDLCAAADRASADYADLWAVRSCMSKRLLPWYGIEAQYPFPEHLQGVVDTDTGDIDTSELNRRIERLAPRVKL